MTAKHIFIGIIIFVAGTILGTGQTLFIQNFPQLETKFHIISPTPTPTVKPIPTFTPTPTASPSATPTPTKTLIRRRYVAPTATPSI